MQGKTWPVSRGVSAASLEATGLGVRTGHSCTEVSKCHRFNVEVHMIKTILGYTTVPWQKLGLSVLISNNFKKCTEQSYCVWENFMQRSMCYIVLDTMHNHTDSGDIAFSLNDMKAHYKLEFPRDRCHCPKVYLKHSELLLPPLKFQFQNFILHSCNMGN